MDEIDRLEQGLANTARVICGVTAEQWAASTPCAEWNVRELANHATWVVHLFGAAVAGTAPPAPDSDVLGDDAAGAFEAAANETVKAWRERGHLDGEVSLGDNTFPATVAITINHLDAYVHGWDLAVATGQDPALDPVLAEPILAAAQDLVPPDPRGANFGPIVDTGADADVIDRMLAYLGRTPC